MRQLLLFFLILVVVYIFIYPLMCPDASLKNITPNEHHTPIYKLGDEEGYYILANIYQAERQFCIMCHDDKYLTTFSLDMKDITGERYNKLYPYDTGFEIHPKLFPKIYGTFE